MYRWTDPTEPDGVARRPEPTSQDGPAWLTDRPEPRSSYLFGDEPEQPGRHPAGTPAGGWPTDAWHAHTDRYPAHPPAGPTGHHPHDPRAAGHPTAPFERLRPAEEPEAAWRPVVADAPPVDAGRHRQRRGLPRPLVIGGAAAAATLVVSLGVSALLLPGGDERTAPTAQDVPAAAEAAPETTGDAPGDAVSPGAAPTSARPTPSRSATPKPSRTTAASRQLARTPAARTTAPRAAVAPGISAELREVVNLVNQERAKAGCKALSIDDKLMLAAQRHSQDQADHKTMTHNGSDGSDLRVRLKRVGYVYSQAAENVAWNQQSPAEVMTAWMNSTDHRKNILNCAYTEIGVGVARSNGPYWTQDFGTPA